MPSSRQINRRARPSVAARRVRVQAVREAARARVCTRRVTRVTLAMMPRKNGELLLLFLLAKKEYFFGHHYD